MKLSRLIWTLGALICFALMFGVPSVDAKETLRLAATTHPDHPYTMTAKVFSKVLEEKTNGEIVVKVFPSAQLGNEREQMEGVTLGTIAFSLPPLALLGNISSSWAGVQMPFVCNNTQVAIESYKLPVIEKMKETLKPKGLLAVMIGDVGIRPYLMRNKRITTIEDIQGLKIRALQSPSIIDSLKAIGASPTPLPYSEIYTALQQGVIDGTDLDLPTIKLGKFSEVAKYVCKVGFIGFPFAILMSKAKFDGYPETFQNAIIEAAKQATEYNYSQILYFEKNAKRLVAEYGCEYNEVQDLSEWQKRVRPTLEKYAKQDPLIDEYLKEVRKLNEKIGK